MSMTNAQGGELKSIFKFTLSNEKTFSIDTSTNSLNYVTASKINERLSADDGTPVGAVSARVLDLEINSLNKALIPENENSIYYGYMDNTAIVEVTVYEDSEPVEFGVFYVDTWESNITDTTPNKVVISATCAMSRTSKLDMPMIDIENILYFKDFIIELFQALSNSYKINVNPSDIIFNTFPKMQFCNVDTATVGTLLNDISKATLTNIYLDREGNLKTDYCCDDTARECKWTIDVMTSAQLVNNNKNYDGLQVAYSRAVGGPIEEVARLSQHELLQGDNSFENIQFNDSLYKVNRIEVDSNTDSVGIIAEVQIAKYNKTKMNLTINSSGNTNVEIIVYGQRPEITEFVKNIGGNNRLSLRNTVLDYNLIDKYIDTMYQYIKSKNNKVVIRCYPTVKLKLGDIVYIDINGALGVSGYYKIVELDWDIAAYAKCEVTATKIYNYTMNINSVLNQQTGLLEQRMSGVSVSTSLFEEITHSEDAYIENQEDIKPYLDKLRT